MAYSVAEGVLQRRTQRGDDPTWLWMIVGSLAGIVLAFVLAPVGPRLPGPGWPPVAIGVGVLCAGAALRYWAVRTLGRFFTVTVEVGEGHELVDDGPYALLRHPSYTGMLTVYLGVGIALDSWSSIVAVLALPTAAVVNRIAREEAMLRGRLGGAYDAYANRTKRLVPGVW